MKKRLAHSFGHKSRQRGRTGRNRYPVYSFAARYCNSLKARLWSYLQRGELLNTHLRTRLVRSLERGRRLGMVFLEIGEDAGVVRRNTLLSPVEDALQEQELNYLRNNSRQIMIIALRDGLANERASAHVRSSTIYMGCRRNPRSHTLRLKNGESFFADIWDLSRNVDVIVMPEHLAK